MPTSRHALIAALALTLLTALASPTPAQDTDEPAQPSNQPSNRWLRYPAISPDGTAICFAYRGDLWVVATEGGRARQLTTHEAYEHSPCWSPDSKTIAFASRRHGNYDVFTVPAEGGAPAQLTYHSADDVPTSFGPDATSVVFSSSRGHTVSARIGSPWMGELYSVALAGGAPRQILTTPAERAQYGDASALIYHDRKGYESPWRKHHTSSVTRDVWLYDARTDGGTHTKITSFDGEDRDPVWVGAREIAYLSEQSGSFEVWRGSLDGDWSPTRVTTHGPHPVRFLTAASDGTLCYGHRGGIQVLAPGAEPRVVAVDVRADPRRNADRREVLRKGATEFAVAPNEKEVAFVVRGEVFVASIKHGTTKRVTDTATQERSVSWAPDGRTLYYAGERDGAWSLFRTTIRRKEEPYFFTSTLLDEELVLRGDSEAQRPRVSPDGKWIAYLHNRDEIRLLEAQSGATRTLVPGADNYSYSDGDIEFDWSPDSRWLTFTYSPNHRWIRGIGVARIETGEITDFTQSGYDTGSPHFSADSRSLLFQSDRFGRRSHGGWGSDQDVFAIDLTRAAHDHARLDRERLELLEGDDDEDGPRKKRRKKKRGKQAPDGEDGDGDGDSSNDSEDDDAEPEKKPPEPVEIEFDGREHRRRRLTVHSSPIRSYTVSPDGEFLVYFGQVEKSWDLWVVSVRERDSTRLLKLGGGGGGGGGAGEVRFSKNGRKLFVRTGDGRLMSVGVGGLEHDDLSFRGKPDSIGFGAEMTIRAAAERAYMFEHAWRQARAKFYDSGLHGADWDGLRSEYERFLPDITEPEDFAELLSELLGELNASHTGARHRPRGGGDSAAADTAALGLIYDATYAGPGLRVAEVLPTGPCDEAKSLVTAGVVITEFDGVTLTAESNPWRTLDHRQGRPLLLGLRAPGSEETVHQTVRPIAINAERQLLYERWVRRCRELVHELSGGRVGYVHVRGMNDASFRRMYDDALGREADREALIVDTRWNGGGWLHDHLVRFFSAQDYIRFVPRGKPDGRFGSEPFDRWSRPACVVQSESNYSDAHMFPHAFKTLGLGKLVGTPVAGTGTAVWWERMIDGATVFGIPQVGMKELSGAYLENNELQPDVEVANDPNSTARGEDAQLATAVRVMLEELAGK